MSTVIITIMSGLAAGLLSMFGLCIRMMVSRFNQLDARFASLEARFGRLEDKVDRMDEKFTRQIQALDEKVTSELRAHGERLARIEAKLEIDPPAEAA